MAKLKISTATTRNWGDLERQAELRRIADALQASLGCDRAELAELFAYRLGGSSQKAFKMWVSEDTPRHITFKALDLICHEMRVYFNQDEYPKRVVLDVKANWGLK